MQRNARQSPLLRLPAELRAATWEHVLRGYTIRLVRPGNHCKLTPSRLRLMECLFALLRVSRQVYLETARLPYTLNTLHIGNLFNYDGVIAKIKPNVFRSVEINLRYLHCKPSLWRLDFPPHHIQLFDDVRLHTAFLKAGKHRT